MSVFMRNEILGHQASGKRDGLRTDEGIWAVPVFIRVASSVSADTTIFVIMSSRA